MADLTNAIYHWLSTDVHDDWLVLCGFFSPLQKRIRKDADLAKPQASATIISGRRPPVAATRAPVCKRRIQLATSCPHVSAWIQPDRTDIVTAPTTFLKPAPRAISSPPFCISILQLIQISSETAWQQLTQWLLQICCPLPSLHLLLMKTAPSAGQWSALQ